MISMYTKQEIIIKSYRLGKSQRKISRELGVSRKTVKKYIDEYEAHLTTRENQEKAHSDYLIEQPVYKQRVTKKIKLTTSIQEKLDEFISTNQIKKQTGLGKQILKKVDMWEALVNLGHEIGYTTVCNYVKSKENYSGIKEAFIRQHYNPGETCEFDWGEVKLKINGKLTTFQLAVFTGAYSNYRSAYLYHRQTTTCFMDSHVQFFKKTGGVYRQMVYDNMRVAVAKFIGKHQKEPTRALLQLRAHYSFTHRFCNAYKGNEKGHVERSVEFVRRKAFALKNDFEDVSQAQTWLTASIDKVNNNRQTGTGKTANELFEEERHHLGTLPSSEPHCSERIQLRVDKYATVNYRQNRYSVPDHLVGEFVDVDILSHDLHVLKDDKIIAVHSLSFEKHKWIINIDHYLSTFKKKPGALPSSVALASNRILKKLYLQYFEDQPRSFIDLLEYCKTHLVSDEKLQLSVKKLLEAGATDINAERLKAFLGNKEQAIQKKDVKDGKIDLLAKDQLLQLSLLLYQNN